jgi:glycosyltransferase involved in cell wall biosynthesis
MRLLLATDAWRPQVNGVVRTLGEVTRRLPEQGVEVRLVTPSDFRTVAMPGYPEIRLAVLPDWHLAEIAGEFRPDIFHIATEGPVGVAARRLALKRRIPFTTSYHTRFPEYLAARLPVPEAASYAWLRRFHNAGCGVMVATRSLEDDLSARGFERLMRWSRGVDSGLFRPVPPLALACPRPIFLNVGRVSVEKNLEAFLGLDLPGSKVVVGDGPARADLQARFPEAIFLGALAGEDLAAAYSAADALVFPSRTDTFGLVMLEALACGLPVAAFPGMGPRDVLTSPRVGVLSENLREAALAVLELDRRDCVAFAAAHTWEASVAQFVCNVRAALAAANPIRVSAA